MSSRPEPIPCKTFEEVVEYVRGAFPDFKVCVKPDSMATVLFFSLGWLRGQIDERTIYLTDMQPGGPICEEWNEGVAGVYLGVGSQDALYWRYDQPPSVMALRTTVEGDPLKYFRCR